MPQSQQEFGHRDARLDGWNSSLHPKVDIRIGYISKIGMVRTSSTGGLGPQTSPFSCMRSILSWARDAAGNTLTRDGSGQSSRTAMPGMATPPSVTSTNSFESPVSLLVTNCSIFRNESASKHDHLPTTPVRVQNFVAPDDEVADGGYYTSPPMNVVASTASVPNFIVGRKGYGKISFKSSVNLTDVSSLSILRRIVELERGRATVYPDESKKPPPGTGLDVPAEVTLENIHPPPDFEGDEYIEELCATPDVDFVSYDLERGLWVFNVNHFSSYSTPWDHSGTSSSGSSRSSSPIPFYRGASATSSASQSQLTSSSHQPSNNIMMSSSSTTPTMSSNQAPRRSGRLRDDKSTIANASEGGNPEIRWNFVTRSREAERVFKNLIEEYCQDLEQYSDAITWPLLSRWMDEQHLKQGVLFDETTKRVTFIEYPGKLQESIIGEILDQIIHQFPRDVSNPSRNKRPDISIMPRLDPNPNYPNHLQVPINPLTNAPYPTLVVEVESSESITSLKHHRNGYLSNATGVNIHIAIGFNRKQAPATDSWYVGIYVRNINPPAPPPNAGPDWQPPPVMIIEHNPNSPYPNFNVGPVPWVANIPVNLLCHPQTLPNPLPQGIPQQITLNFEDVRTVILEER